MRNVQCKMSWTDFESLPLSFFTSYFGMNVQDITGDDQNTTTQRIFWSICAPITVTAMTLAVLVAFNEGVRDSIKRLSRQLSR
jgi:Mg2+ and Co2+ transporter CorA